MRGGYARFPKDQLEVGVDEQAPAPPAPASPTEELRRARYHLGEVFVVETRPRQGPLRAPAFVVLPPLGYEDTSAYRPLRALAAAVAARGHLVLRLDWPGLGDSGGDAADPDLLPRQLDAVRAVVASLRARGLPELVGIGVRGGGLLGLAAGGFDGMVLWGTPAHGGALLREERAFHRMAARAYGEPPADAPPLPAGAVEAGGFWYAPTTVAGLQGLAGEALGGGAALRRVLVLPRDHAAPPAELLASFPQAEVEVAAALGLADLLEDPYHAALAAPVREAVLAWIRPGPLVEPGAAPTGEGLRLPGGIVERPWVSRGGRGELVGVVCTPAGGPGPGATWTLFLNAGGVRRAGPNRLWTRAARHLAAAGRPSLRLDVRDVGDSDGPDLPHADLEAMYSQDSVADVLVALDDLEAAGAGAVELVGLCSGAYLAIQAADRRTVRRALLFNCLAYVWDDDARASGFTSQIGRSLLDGRRWRRLLAGRIDRRALARAILRRGQLRLHDTAARLRGAPPEDPVAALLRRVRARGTRVELVCSAGDPSIDLLERHVPASDRPPLTVLPGVDHTIRPVWAHARVLDLIASPAAPP